MNRRLVAKVTAGELPSKIGEQDARRLHVNADELTEAILEAVKEIADERST